jgi:hypothetical protein
MTQAMVNVRKKQDAVLNLNQTQPQSQQHQPQQQALTAAEIEQQRSVDALLQELTLPLPPGLGIPQSTSSMV